MTFLQASAALAAARKMFDRARAAAEAAPGDKAKAKSAIDLAASLTAAYQNAIDASAGTPALQTQRDNLIAAKVIHHEKYEKKTVETEDKPADPPESEEEEEAVPETAPSKEMPPSSSKPAAPAPKRGKAKRAESEEEEEEAAIAASYARASASYRREMAGKNVDALGVLYGPEALVRACMSALGTASIRETFGALAGLKEKLTATAAIAVDVEALKRRDRATRVESMIDRAKADGVPMPADRRKYLREQGALHGTAHLKGLLAQFPRLPTKALDAAEDGADGREQFQGDDLAEAAIQQACAAVPQAQRAEFEAMLRANLKATATKIPAA